MRNENAAKIEWGRRSLEQGAAIELHRRVLYRNIKKKNKSPHLLWPHLVVVALLQSVRTEQRTRVVVAPLPFVIAVRKTKSDLDHRHDLA